MTDTGLVFNLLSPSTFALIFVGCCLVQGLFGLSDHGCLRLIKSLGTFSGHTPVSASRDYKMFPPQSYGFKFLVLGLNFHLLAKTHLSLV